MSSAELLPYRSTTGSPAATEAAVANPATRLTAGEPAGFQPESPGRAFSAAIRSSPDAPDFGLIDGCKEERGAAELPGLAAPVGRAEPTAASDGGRRARTSMDARPPRPQTAPPRSARKRRRFMSDAQDASRRRCVLDGS